MRKAQNKAAPINSSGIAPVPMRIGSLLDEDSTVKNLKKKKQGLEPEFGGKSSLPSSSASPRVNPKLLKMKPKEPPKGSAIQEFYRNLQKANAQYRYNLQNHPIKPKIFVELVKSTSSSPKRRNLAPSAEEPFLVAKGTITVNEGIVHFRVYQILNICYSVDLALNDSSALEVEEEENHVNQPASDERRKWTVFIPQTELTNELNRLFTFSRKSYYYHKFLYFIMICVEVHFATSITPTNVLPSIYPSEGGWMHPSSRSNSPFQYHDAHERGNNGSEAKTRKFISKTSFQQASFDRLCQYFIQKIYLNASKRLFLFFQRCLNSFLHEKELIKQRKIKQSQHMASTRAREKISQYVLEKQQRLEYLAATNPLLVAKEMKNDLLFNKFSKQLTGSAGTSANRGNESLDDSTLESLLGLPITSYSNVNKTGSAVGTAKPVMTPTTPAAASTPNGVAYEGSSGTMSNNLAESSSLKSNSRDMALNPANHHRGYSVSGNNTPLLNPTKPSSPPRHASVKPGDSQLPPRKARLPSVVKKSSVQYNGARHYSVTATSDDILGTLSNPSNDVRDNHYIHGSVLMPGMNPIGSNNANLSSFRNEISSILGVFEEEIHTLKQELETQKLNYFYSRGRLDLAYTPYEEEKTDLVAPRSRSGATPSSTTNTGKPLSEATNDTSQNNVNILMNSLSTSLPASARTSMLSSGEAGRRENNTSPRASASALEHENHQLKSELENMQKKLESFEASLQQTQQMAQRMEDQKLQQLQEQWQQNTHQLLQSTTETARQQLLQEFQELFHAKEEEMQSLQSQLALMEQKKPPGQRDRSISAEVMKFQIVEERLQHEYEEMMEQQKVLQAQIQQLMQEKQQAVHQPSKAGRRESVVGFEDLEEEEASPSKEFPGLGLSLFDYYRGSSNNTNKLMKSPRKVAETPRNQNGEELHMYRGDSTQAIKVTTNNKKPTNKKINSSTDTPMSSHRSAHMSVSGEVKPLAESVRESSELPSPTSANDNNEEEVALISEDKVDEVLPTSAVEQPLPDSPSNFIPFGITAKSISRQFLLSPGSIKPPEISIVLSPKSDGKLREGDVTVTHNTTLNAPSSRPMTPKTPKSPKMPKNMGGGSGGGVGGGGGGGAPRGGRKLHPATAGTRSANAKKMAGVQLASSSMSRRAVAQQQQEKKGFSWFSFFFGKRATTPAPTEKDSSMHQSEAGESHMSGINLEQTNIFDLHESRDEEEEKRQKEEEEAKAREEARKREEERIYKNACILQKYMKQVTFLYSTASKSNLIYLRWRFLLPVINSPELLAKRLEQESDFLNQMISFSQEIIALILEKLVQHLQGTKSSAGGRNDVWNVLDEQLLQFPLLIFLLIEGMMKKYEKMSIIYPFLMLSHFQQFVEQFLFLLIPLQYFLSSSSILPTKNRGGGVGSRLAAEAAENWNNLLKKYFNLMRIVYKIDLLKCMEDFTMMKQYMNFLLKGIHLFHSLGMKRCQQHPTDSLQDAQPFSLSMPVTTSASEGSVKNGFDESEGSLSPRSRHKKEKKRVKDDGDIVIPPQLQELFQHLLIQVILLPVTSLEQIDIHHGKFIVLLFKLIEKHYDMASGKTGEGKRNDQFQQPLVILPSENNNHPNSAAMTLKRQQEREKLFQSMYFLYFLDDLMTKYFLLVEDIHREEQEEASKTVPSPRKAWNKQQGGAMMSVTTRSAEKEEKVVFANKQLHYCLKLFITLLHHASEEQKSYYFLLKFHEKYFYYLLHYYQKNWFLMTWYHKICQILIYLNITFISSPAPSLPQSSSEMTGMVVRGYDMIQSHCLSGVFPSILMKLFLTLFQQYQYDFQQRRKGQQQQMQQQQTKYQPPPQIALPEELVDAHSLSDVDKSSSTHHTPKQVHRVRSDYSALTSMPANDQIDFSTSLKVLASPSVKFTSGGDDVSAGVGVSSPMSAMSGMSPKEKSNLTKKVNLQVNTRSINNEEIHSALTSPVQGTAVVNSTSVSTFPHLLTPTVAPTMNNNNTTQNNKLNYFLDYCKLLFSCYYQNEANLMKLYANGMIDMMTHVLDNLMQLLHQTLEETENEGRSVPASVYDINQLQEVCEYVYFLMVYCLNSIPTSTIASSQNHLLNASHQKIVMVIQKYSNHLFKSPPRRRSFIGEVEEKAALERRISHQQTMQHVIEQMLNLYFSERKRNRGVIPSLPPTMTANGEVAGNFVYYRCGFKEMEAILSME